MADGAVLGSVCYSSQESALDAFYTAAPVGWQVSGTNAYLTYFEKVSGVWHVKRFSADSASTLVSDAVAPVPAFPVCDTFEHFKDGQELGWGVTAAIIAAWCIANMKRGL